MPPSEGFRDPAHDAPGARHLVLVGMMGAGKTTVGEALAVRLGRDYADTDDLVEAATHLSVREIFEHQGEDEFRRLEAVMLHHALAVGERGVIGCGGGIVTQPGARRLLRDGRGFVVWLRATPATLAGRLAGATDRPLLDGDPVANLGRLTEERRGWYDEVADLIVDVDDVSVEDIVETVSSLVGVAAP